MWVLVLNEVLTLPPQFTSHKVDLAHCSIFYQQGGTQFDKIPILFLHGWGISVEPYQEILEGLARQHPVLAPDLPSFARSSYSQLIPDYESYARLLIQFLDALGLNQVHLAGHSFGGGLAIAIAALSPDRVKSAVLIGSTGIPAESIPEVVPRRAVEMTVQTFLPRLRLKFWDIPLVFTSNLLFNTGNVIWALLLSLQADLRPLMPKVKAPCLLIWSDKDITIPLDVAQEMANILPNARLTTVEQGCHEWGLWYPEKLTPIVLQFVTAIERANGRVAVPS